MTPPKSTKSERERERERKRAGAGEREEGERRGCSGGDEAFQEEHMGSYAEGRY